MIEKKRNEKQSQQNNGQQKTNTNDNEQDMAKTTESSFLQKSGGFGENQCFCCGATGHFSNKFKHKDRAKNQWAVCKSKMQTHNGFCTGVDDDSQDDLVSTMSTNDNGNANTKLQSN